MAPTSLSLIILRTKHRDDVIAFYAALGIDVVREKVGKSPSTYTARIGDVTLEFLPQDDELPAPEPNVRLGFVVDDVDEALAAVKALGAVVVNPPQSSSRGFRAVVRDPDGRSIEIFRRAPA